jgi:hypothetical protein
VGLAPAARCRLLQPHDPTHFERVLREAQFAFFFAMPAALLFSAAFYASLHASVHGCLDFSGEPAGTREDAPPTDTGSA